MRMYRSGVANQAKKKKVPRSKSAQQREARLRKQRRRKVRTYIVATVVVLAVVAALVIAFLADRESVEGVVEFDDLSRDHTEEPVEYEQNPPVGGAHSATPLTCGVYPDPVPNENAVHSLEHGAVWITYQPDLDEQDVTALNALLLSQNDATRRYMILSPYEGQPEPVMLTAWGRQLTPDGVDDPRVQEFIDQYVLGRNAPETGSPCIGATMN